MSQEAKPKEMETFLDHNVSEPLNTEASTISQQDDGKQMAKGSDQLSVNNLNTKALTNDAVFENEDAICRLTRDRINGEDTVNNPTNESANLELSDQERSVQLKQNSRKFICKPKRFFHDIRAYVALLCLFYIFFAMSYGTFAGSISTIEKRFNFKSSQSGMIIGSYEIGHLLFTLLVSHFGNRYNIPRIFSLCLMGVTVAHILITLPKFVVPAAIQHTSMQSLDNNITENLLHVCRETKTIGTQQDNATCIDVEQEATAASSDLAMAIFLIAFISLGSFGTVGTTLAISYLDDNTKSAEQSTFYLGLSSSCLCVGALVGGFVNAQMLAIPEDLRETNLTPEHPSWIGAWWLQKILEAGFFLIPAIPLFFFPRRMKREDDRIPKDKEDNKLEQQGIRQTEETDKGQRQKGQTTTDKNVEHADKYKLEQADDKITKGADDSYLKEADKNDSQQANDKESKAQNKQNCEKNGDETYTWKSFVSTLRRLVCNPTYVCLTLAGCCNTFLTGGIMAFNAKYIETQFAIAAWKASTITGVILGIAGFLGAMIGGIVYSKLSSILRTKVKFILATLAVSYILFIPTMFIGCDPVKIAQTSSESSCQVTCGCSSDDLDPVCDPSTGFTFLTPCQAGCISLNVSESAAPVTKMYLNCSCSHSGHVMSGLCPRDCTTSLVLYSLTMAVFVFLRASKTSTVMVMTLRCVNKSDKGLSIGFGTWVMSLLGWMPTATVFGMVIDSTCSIWQSTCSSQSWCWLYNSDDLRHMVHGVSIALVSAELILFVGVLYVSRGKFLDTDEKRNI